MIQYLCDSTDYCVDQHGAKKKVLFAFSDKSLIINFCDSDEMNVEQSEIGKVDAIKLAKLILHYYEV